MFQTKIVEKIKTHFMFSIFLSENLSVVEKYCRAGQAADDKMVHENCILDT